MYCQLLGAADVGHLVLATQCWPLSVSPLYDSVSEAVAQLAQVVLLCTKLVTGSALTATLT